MGMRYGAIVPGMKFADGKGVVWTVTEKHVLVDGNGGIRRACQFVYLETEGK